MPTVDAMSPVTRLRLRYIMLAVELAQLHRTLREAARLLAEWQRAKNGRSGS